MLANGEVDLIGGMYAAEGVDDRFLLSNDSYAMLEVELQVPVEQVVNPVSAAEASGTLRVAVTDGSRLIEDAQRYCDARHIDLQPVTCVDRDDQLQAVRDGRADAVLATSMGSSKGVRSAARLAARPVCFATSAGDEALMAELNGAMTSISCGDPQFWTGYAKYFSSSAGELVLTDDERAYVEHAAPIRVGVLRDQAPYQYEEDGELKGVAVDLLAVVAEKTGLTFEYVGVDSNADLAEKQAQGLIDLQACAAFDYDAAREAGVSLTQPYVRASYVLVMNEHVGESDLAGKRLALSATSTYNGMFVGDVHRFDSVADCLRAVVDGRADYTYLDEYVVQYYLNTPDFDNLKLAPQTHDPRQMSFGVVKGADGPAVHSRQDHRVVCGNGNAGRHQRERAAQRGFLNRRLRSRPSARSVRSDSVLRRHRAGAGAGPAVPTLALAGEVGARPQEAHAAVRAHRRLLLRIRLPHEEAGRHQPRTRRNADGDGRVRSVRSFFVR
ncbi:MAG: transporter substrate-binding domain-containing protein [Eggerthellaceae bacterium]